MIDNQNLVKFVYSWEYTMTSMRCQMTKVIHLTPVSHIAEGKQPSTGEIRTWRGGGEACETSFTPPISIYLLHAYSFCMHTYMHAVYKLLLHFMFIALMVSMQAITPSIVSMWATAEPVRTHACITLIILSVSAVCDDHTPLCNSHPSHVTPTLHMQSRP